MWDMPDIIRALNTTSGDLMVSQSLMYTGFHLISMKRNVQCCPNGWFQKVWIIIIVTYYEKIMQWDKYYLDKYLLHLQETWPYIHIFSETFVSSKKKRCLVKSWVKKKVSL